MAPRSPPSPPGLRDRSPGNVVARWQQPRSPGPGPFGDGPRPVLMGSEVPSAEELLALHRAGTRMVPAWERAFRLAFAALLMRRSRRDF